MIKNVIGIIIVILGIALSIYLGVYLMLFGGIVQIINNIDPVNAKEIAIGIIKIIFCELGIIPLYICFIIAASLND